MSNFDTAVEHVLAKEGGYVNNPNDSGGETIWGVTIGTARTAGYTGAMKLMTRDQAKQIYRKLYWDSILLDNVNIISSKVADKMFDMGVNLGIGQPVKMLQRVLNVLNRQQADYPDVIVDGLIGPKTISNLNTFIKKRGVNGETVIIKALSACQAMFYISLAENRQKDEEFVYGWVLNRV